MSISDSIKNSKRNKQVIRLTTKHSDGDFYDGVVLHEAKNFVLISQCEDFEFDGYTFLAKSYINGYRDGKFEASYNKVLRFNGQDKKLKTLVWFKDCKTWEDIFKNLHKNRVWPAVETYTNKGKYSDLYVGPVVTGSEKQCVMHTYDAEGAWEHEYTVKYKDILRVEFNDKYTYYFNKYMKSRL